DPGVDLEGEQPTRFMAAFALAAIDPQNTHSVPVLINALSYSFFTRDKAIEGLGKIGPNARAAIPSLRRKVIPMNKRPTNNESEGRDGVVNYFQGKAAYRRNLAEEKPESAGKNESYAKSLELMSAYVAGLPDDHPDLQKLVRCRPLYDEDFEMF